MAAEGRGPLIHARIGVTRALNRGHIREFNTSRKEPRWGHIAVFGELHNRARGCYCVKENDTQLRERAAKARLIASEIHDRNSRKMLIILAECYEEQAADLERRSRETNHKCGSK